MNILREKDKFGDDGNYHFSVKLYSRAGKGLYITPHYHDCIEIIYGISGAIEVDVTDTNYIVNPGDMLVIFSDEVHGISTLSRDDNEFAIIKYDPEILYSTSQSASETKFLITFASTALVSNRIFTKETLNGTRIPTLIDDILHENSVGGFGSEIAVRLSLCQLFLWILRSWKAQDDENNFTNVNNIDAIYTLQKIFDYVENEYMNKIKIETIAAQLNMSYYSFSKFFIANTGKTFPRYLNEVRLTKSKILLTTTGMNITEIALEVGFISSSHYIQRFKEGNKMTPQQFRKEFLK